MYIEHTGGHYFIVTDSDVIGCFETFYQAACVLRFIRGGNMGPGEYKCAVAAMKGQMP